MTTIAFLPRSRLLAERMQRDFPDDRFVVVDEGRPLEEIDGLKDAEVLYGTGPAATVRAIMKVAPKAKWYATPNAGVEQLIDSGLIGTPGLTVTNGRSVYDVSIAEHVIACIFSAAKHIPEYVRAQEKKVWLDGAAGTGRHAEVRGSTLVIHGMGAIGGELARQAHAVGMRVVGVRRSPGAPPPGVERVVGSAELLHVVSEADFLAVCAPHTPATRGSVSSAVIAAMKPTAWIVNIARGRLIDTAALISALTEKRIGGAALDVFDVEPLPSDSPLWALENVFITPHSSNSSPHLEQRHVDLFADQFRRWKRGEALRNVVTTDIGY